MLHTKFQGHRSISSGDFLRFLPYIDVVAYWSCDLDGLNIFLFPTLLEALSEIWLQVV